MGVCRYRTEAKHNLTVSMMLFFRWASWKGTPKPLRMLYTVSIMYAESTPHVSIAKQISTCIPAAPMFLHLPVFAWSTSGGSLGWDALELFPWQLKWNLSVSLGKDQGEQCETLNTKLISFHSFSVKAGSLGDLCLWPHHLAEASQAESLRVESWWGKNKTCVAAEKTDLKATFWWPLWFVTKTGSVEFFIVFFFFFKYIPAKGWKWASCTCIKKKPLPAG